MGTTSPHRHAVQFYEDSASLCRMVADFLGDGFAAGEPAVVIATPAHEQQIMEELTRRRIEVDQVRRAGELVVLDAEETLGACMINGTPDGELFSRYLGTVLRQVGRIRPRITIRAYGEMVDVLWKAGQTEAAVKLEVLWNALALQHNFSLLCGYAMGQFYKEPECYRRVCDQHSEVIRDMSAANPHRTGAPAQS